MINRVILVGNLGNDPELSALPSGGKVCNFRMATSEKWIDKETNEKQSDTQWHSITVFGKQAETCKRYLAKGRTVYVEGKIKMRQFDKDGIKHYRTDIIAKVIQFFNDKKETPDYADNDIPF